MCSPRVRLEYPAPLATSPSESVPRQLTRARDLRPFHASPSRPASGREFLFSARVPPTSAGFRRKSAPRHLGALQSPGCPGLAVLSQLHLFQLSGPYVIDESTNCHFV